MARPSEIARSIRLFKDASLSPQALSQVLAQGARRARDRLIAEGRAPRSYTTFVDGRQGASEDLVSPNGVIAYEFTRIGNAAIQALTFLRTRSPVDSGEFRKQWAIVVNGRPIEPGDAAGIPSNAEVMLVNPLPYARKVDVGAMRMSVPAGAIEAARQFLQKAFPTLDVERTFVRIPSGMFKLPNRFGPVPYVLKGHAHLRRVQQTQRSRAFREGRIYLLPRKDTARGAEMTYPALVFKAKQYA